MDRQNENCQSAGAVGGVQTRGPWHVHGERIGFENPWMRIHDYQVTTPSGDPGRYGVVGFKNVALAILPVFDNGDVVLVGQHRFALDHYSWELPEGGGPKQGEPGSEPPLAAAQRELKEETGLLASDWSQILAMDMSNSITDERAMGFLATGLTQGEAEPEPDEVLAVRRLHFTQLLDEVMSGAIRDALTVAMTLKAYTLAGRGGLEPALANAILEGPLHSGGG